MSASESVRKWLGRLAQNQAVPLNRSLLPNPALELLEDRAVPTVYLVDTTLDLVKNDGLVSLREAVLAANTGQPVGDAPAGDGNDQIGFASALAGQSIGLQQNFGPSNFGNTALAVSRNLGIEGLPAGTLSAVTIRNDASYGDRRLFLVQPGANLQLNDVILADGAAVGDSGLSGANGGGGGGGGAGMGGAILNQGSLGITNSTLTNNLAVGGRGGDGATNPTAQATGGKGGGSSGGQGGSPNVAGQIGGFGSGGGGGGGLGLTASGAGGFAQENGFGGGAGGGSATNPSTAGDFAGRNVVFGGRGGQGAVTQGGGGGGGAGMGGAIYNLGGSVSIANSTFGFNEARGGLAGQGGTQAAAGLGLGGAIFSQNGFVRVDNSTLARNTASQGGALFVVADGAAASATINSTVAAQSGGVSDAVGAGIHGGNLNISGVANLIQYADNFAAGTATNQDPQLTNLAQNGGPTPTFALRSGSPALDAGANLLGLTSDQRGAGFPRTVGSSVDIGAFEYGNSFAPRVLSINRDTSPGSPSQTTNASIVRYVVAYSQDVTGVTVSDFALAGSGVNGAIIQSVTPVTGSSSNYIVEVSTGADGSLGLNQAQPGTAANSSGDKVQGSFQGEYFNIDKTQPTVVGINLVDTNPTNADTVHFAIVFSKDLKDTPTTGNFSLQGSGVSGVISSVDPVPGSSSAFVVTVTSVVGSGTLQLNLSNSVGITDQVGNTLQSSFFSGQQYVIDQVAPKVNSITLLQDRVDTEGALEFEIVFSKPVNRNTVNGSTVQASSTGGVGLGLGTITGSGDTYRVRINGISGTGTVSVSIANNANIFDLYGNQLGLGLTGSPIAVSTTKPWVKSIVPSVLTPTNLPFDFVVTFSKDIQPASVGVDDFALVGEGTVIGKVVSVTPTINSAQFLVHVDGLVGTGRLGIDISPAANILDQATGQRVTGTFTDTQFAQVDTNGPLVISVLPMDPNPSQDSSLRFQVVFDKDVDPATVLPSAFTVSGPAGSAWGATLTQQDPNFPQVWIVTVQNAGAAANGQLRLSVPSGGGIKDLAGNDLARTYDVGQSYTLTASAPAVSSITRANANPTKASLVGYYINFSEDIDPQTLNPSDFVVKTVSGTASGVVSSISGSGKQFLILVTVTDGDGQLRLDTANNAEIFNLAGVKINAQGNTSGQVYDILFQPPTVVSSQPENGPRSGQSTVSFLVDFSAAMNPVTLTPQNFQALTMGLSGSAYPSSVVPDPVYPNQCRVYVTGYSGTGSIILNVLGNKGAQDAAGNPLIQGFTGGTPVQIDTVAVGVTSITPTQPASNQLNPLNLYTFQVNLSGPVDPTTLSPSAFSLSGTTTGTISGLVVDPFNPSLITVQVNGVSAQGTLQVNLVPNSGVKDTFGNLVSPLGFTGTQMIFSTAQPSIQSITLVGGPTVVGSSATYNIVFVPQNGCVIDPASVNPAALSLDTSGSVQGVITSVVPSPTLANTFVISVNNITGKGTMSVLVPAASQIHDIAGNTLAGLPFQSAPATNVNAIGPVVVTVDRVGSTPTNATSATFRVVFSEPVNGATLFANYLPVRPVTLSGAITAVVPTVGALANTSFDVTVGSLAGRGLLGLRVIGAAITNADGTLFNGPFNAGQTYFVDNQAPSVTSSTPDLSGPNSASSLVYSVVFAEPVMISTVTPSVLNLVQTGSATGTLGTITPLNVSEGQFASTYQVAVSSVGGTGTIGLGILANSNISDPFGNLMTAAFTPTNVSVVNHATPTVSSMVIGTPTPVTGGTVSILVSFSTPIDPSTVNASDFEVVSSVYGAITSVVPTDSGNQVFQVTISGVQGFGYAGIGLVANAKIRDFSGNLITPAAVSGPLAVVLNIAPMVTSIRASQTQTNGQTASFDIQLTQNLVSPVGDLPSFPVDISNFFLSMGGSLSGQIAGATVYNNAGNAHITVDVNNLSGHGTLNLGVVNNTNLVNIAGIPLSQGFDSSVSQTIEVNTTVTTAQSIDLGGDVILDPTLSQGRASFVVTFSEPVEPATISLAAFQPLFSGTATGTLDSIQGSGNTYLVLLRGISGTGSLQLNLRANSGIRNTFGTEVTQDFTGSTYTVGTISPEAAPNPTVSINAFDNSQATSRAVVQFEVQFNRDMVGSTVTPEKFELVTTGGATGRIASVSGSGQTFLVTVDNVSGTGTVSLRTIANPLFRDYFGSVINGQPASLTGFSIDHSAPAVSQVTIDPPSQTNLGVVGFTIQFAETVDPLTINSQTVYPSFGGAGHVTSIQQLDPTTYRVLVATEPVSGRLGLTLDGVCDYAGNRLFYETTDAQSYTVDRVGPMVRQISLLDPSPSGAASVRFQVEFTENVDASTVTLSAFNTLVSGTLSANIRSIQGTGATYILTVDVLGGSGNLNITVPSNAPIADLVGNFLVRGFASSQAYTIDKIAPKVVSFVPSQLAVGVGQPINFLLTFDSPINASTLVPGVFLVQGTGTASGIVTNIVGSGAQYEITVTPSGGNGAISLELPAFSGVQDQQGNEVAPAFTSQSCQYQAVAPSVTNLIPLGSSIQGGPVIQFQATFSQPMDPLSVTSDSIVFQTLGNAMVGFGSVQWTSPTEAVLSVNVVNGQGSIALQIITGKGIRDLAGNDLSQGATSAEVLLEVTPPSVLEITPEGPFSTNAPEVSFAVHFTESMPAGAVTASAITVLTTGTLQAQVVAIAQDAIDPSVFHITVGGPMTGAGNLNISIPNGAAIFDEAGNRLFQGGATVNAYYVNRVTPVVTGIVPWGNGKSGATNPGFIVNFNEAIPYANVNPTDFNFVAVGTFSAGMDVDQVVPLNPSTGGATQFLVFLNNADGFGTITLGISPTADIKDAQGNQLDPLASVPSTPLDFNSSVTSVDSVEFVGTVPSPTNQSTITYQIVFGAPVTGIFGTVLTPADFLAVASNGGTARGTVSAVTGSGTTYQVTVSFVSGTGDLGVSPATTVVNSYGVPVALGTPSPYALANVDRTPPAVVSIVRTGGGSAVSGSPTSTWTVTFSKEVNASTVNPGDFTLIASGTLVAEIVDVTGSGDTYTVTVRNITGDGALNLSVPQGVSIFDMVGNRLVGDFTAGETYSTDRVAPRVSEIFPLGDSIVRAGSQTVWLVLFDKPVQPSSVTPEIFTLANPDGTTSDPTAFGHVASVAHNPGNAYEYFVIVDQLGGNGQIRLDLPSGSPVVDAAGNRISNGFTSASPILVDSHAPVPLSITPSNNSPTAAAGVGFVVTFDSPILYSTLTPEDFEVIGTKSASGIVASFTQIDAEGKVFGVQVAGITGEGTLGLTIRPTAQILDQAGNALAYGLDGQPPYTVDRVAPTVENIATVPAGSPLVTGSSAIFEVAFTELVTASTVNIADFNLVKTGGVLGQITLIVPKSGTTFDSRFLVTVTGISGSGSLALQVPSGATITDKLGNNLSGGYTLGQTFSVRTTAPTVSSITTTLPTNQIVRVSSAAFTLTFSKPVLISTVNTNSLKVGTVGGITGAINPVDIVPQNGDLTTASVFKVVISNIRGSGSLQLSVQAGIIRDASGQILTVPLAGPLVSIDNQAPAIVGTPFLNSNPTSANTLGFRVNFNENVVVESVLPTSFALAGWSGNGQVYKVVPATAPVNGMASAFNVFIQGVSGSGNLGIGLLANSGISDALGNTQNGTYTSANSYSISSAPVVSNPLVSSVVLDPANPATATSAYFLVNFSKPVDPNSVLTTSFTTTIPAATIDLVTQTGPTQFAVTVSQAGKIDGNLRLNIPAVSGIVDATNPLNPCLSFFAGETLNRTSVNVVSSTVDTTSATNGGINGRVVYHVTSSVPVLITSVTGNLGVNFGLTPVSGNPAGVVLAATAADANGGYATRFDVEVGGLAGLGQLRLDVLGSNLILSGAGNPTNAFTGGQSYNIDAVAPVISSIVSLNGALTSASQVTWRVTFSKPVDPASFTAESLLLLESGSAQGGFASINGSGSVYQITANVVEGMGTLGLWVLPGRIKDLAGNTMTVGDTGGETNVDYTPPRVLGVAIKDPGIVGKGPATFAIGFSKAMNSATVTTSALKLVSTPAHAVVATISSVSATGSNEFDVLTNINSGTGILALDAIVGRARDAAGNPLVASFQGGQTYQVSADSPVALFATIDGQSPTRLPSLDYIVTFAVPMDPQTVVSGAFQIQSTQGSVVGSISKVVPIDDFSTRFRVTVDNVTGNGTLVLMPVNGNTMKDQLGQVLAYNPYFTSGSYQVDHIPPAVSSISIQGNSLTNASKVSFLVTFTEEISSGSQIPAAFGLVTTGNLIGRVALVEHTSGNIYRVTVDNLYGEGSVALQVLGNGLIADRAGNTFVGNPVTGPAITISTVAPTVTSITTVGATKTNSSAVQFQVTFSQPMDLSTVQPQDFVPVFTGTLTGQTATVVAMPGSNSMFLVTVANLSGTGTVALSVPENSTLSDQAGNQLQSSYTSTANFDVNTIAPVITSFKSLEGYNPTSKSAPFLLTFSEAVTGVQPSSFSIIPAGAGTIANLQSTDGGVTWTFNVVAVRQGSLTVTLNKAGISDTYGNPLAQGGSVSINYAPALPTVAALGAGGVPMVQVITADGSVKTFQPFASNYRGGLTVAAGDINGDGVADIIVGVASGAAPHVKVFSGTNYQVIRSFYAFATSFTGGVNVAAGDINGDGYGDVIVGSGLNARPHVRAYSGLDNVAIRSFFAYSGAFTGGVRVATGDVDGDGIAEIITGSGAGTRGHIKVFKGGFNTVIRSFFAYGPGVTNGVFVAAGDLDGDGKAEIVAALDKGGQPLVRTFTGAMNSVNQEFLAFSSAFRGGTRVAIVNRASEAGPLIAAGNGPGLPSQVKTFDGKTTHFIDTVFVLSEFGFQGGVFVG